MQISARRLCYVSLLGVVLLAILGAKGTQLGGRHGAADGGLGESLLGVGTPGNLLGDLIADPTERHLEPVGELHGGGISELLLRTGSFSLMDTRSSHS